MAITTTKKRKEIVKDITEAALRGVIKKADEDVRADYVGTATDSHTRKGTTISVQMACDLCSAKLSASVYVKAADYYAPSTVVGKSDELSRAVVNLLRRHHISGCPLRMQAEIKEKRKKPPEPEQEAPTKKPKPKAKACKICGITESKYPPWDGPCSHLLDSGVTYKRFDIIAKEYRL